MELESLVQIFGGAGTTFYVMWLWVKSVQKENEDLKDKLETEKDARIVELKEMLPLLTDASNGLQDVIKNSGKRDTEVVESIKTHIDEKVTEISEKCKKK